MTFNRTLIDNVEEENSKFKDGNFRLLGSIIKEKEKYFFKPLLIDLGNDREDINDVSWLIYNKKTNPEINHSYILKEGDILKMGNVIFQIKMIQINENDEELKEKNELESNNNTLIISGSANQSLVLNKNYDYDNENLNITSKKVNIKTQEKKYNSDKPPEPNEFQKLPGEKDNISKNSKKNKKCRICYQEEDDILINPLIRPCKCSGSMKYIHLKCLLHWLKSRTSNNQMISNTNENFNAYFINQKTECELCKHLFPDYIKHNNIKYCLIDFDYAQEKKIKGNNNNEQNYVNTNMEYNNIINQNSNKNNEEKNSFIVMDTLYPLTDNNKYRYIIKFDENNEMRIGRGLDNQLILNEITVSRNHCLLKLEKNKYGKYEIRMEDESSKFGSLILMQSNKIEIIKGKPLHIQISNIHIIIQYKKNLSFSCCNVHEIDERNSYEKINNRAVKNKNVINVLTEINSDDGGENAKKVLNNNENKSNGGKEIKINKNNDNMLLLLNQNNDSNKNQKEIQNMKTSPKENCDKNEGSNHNENKELNENKNENNKVINDSVEVEEEYEKNN